MVERKWTSHLRCTRARCLCHMPVVDTATATGPQALGTATDARWSLWWGRTISRTGDVVVSEGGEVECAWMGRVRRGATRLSRVVACWQGVVGEEGERQRLPSLARLKEVGFGRQSTECT